MKVIILAAGEGVRMHPLTHTRPKVMITVANKPILEHLIIRCCDAGLSEFIIVTGYREDIIKSYFGDGQKWGIHIKYVTQEGQLGTADAVRMARSLVGEKFLLLNGDILPDPADIARIVARGQMCMGIFPLAEVKHLGVVEIKDGTVQRIHEKVEIPPTNLINAGVYLLTDEIFRTIEETPKSPRGEYELTDSLQRMINSGQNIFSEMLTSWEDISYPWHLLNINEKLLQTLQNKNLGTVESGVFIKGKASIGEGTVVKSGSYIEGPVVIGNGCTIGPNCFLRGSTSIGNYCHIGAAVEIKNSIVMDHSNVPHLNYVGDTIIGEGCNLGAGTKIANLRLDKGNIEVKGIDTKRRKLGAIIGDNVQTGINVSINIGTMIDNDAAIGPGVFVAGIIPAHAVLTPRKARPGRNKHKSMD